MAVVANIFGLRPDEVTAWATVALASVGIVSIITGIALALAARRSNNLQREELDLLTTQLDLSRPPWVVSDWIR